MALPWDRLDDVTYSWQKVLGGEAQHGVLILSPRAVERLESHAPAWPLPKIFRITKDGALNEGVFRGETVNTPSMLCVEDALDGLKWAESIGGARALIERCEGNLASVARWVENRDWIDFLAVARATRSCTSVCLEITAPWFQRLDQGARAAAAERMAGLLEDEGVAYDINGYRDAPPGLRLWTGATVERTDVEALLPWLDWAYARLAEDARTKGWGRP
jgi:phosphoserine aminotransferase